MALRSLKHEMLNDIDVNKLLRRYNKKEIALIFKVPQEYVTKVMNAQRIIAEIDFKKTSYFKSDDEMKLGKVGAWMGSKERKYIKQFRK